MTTFISLQILCYNSLCVIPSVSSCLYKSSCWHACLQVVRLSIERHVVQLQVDVRVVLTTDPADGCAVERGARAHVGLQRGQRLGLLGGAVHLWELKGQHLGRFVVAAKRQCRPGNTRGA